LENEIYDKLKDDEEPYCPKCKNALIEEISEEVWKKLNQKKEQEDNDGI